MTNHQGTEFETWIVNRAQLKGIPAIRLVKQGQADEADVMLMGHKDWNIPALLWKRIVNTGKKTRQPLGERFVAVLVLDDFLDLLVAARGNPTVPAPTVWVQAKWAEQISVTKVLKGLRDWLIKRTEQT